MNNRMHKGSLWITLFTSGSTLICCAIPAILVLLGAGATVAAVVGVFPQLVWLSEHKIWLFGFGAIMLGVSRYYSHIRPAACPVDPLLAQECKRAKQWSNVVWWVSTLFYAIGFGVSYVLPLFI